MTGVRAEIEGGRQAFAPGETIGARISWDLEDRVASIRVSLIYATCGKGTTDQRVHEVVLIDEPPLVGHDRVEFIAPDGPHSFSGRLVSLGWQLSVEVAPEGAARRARGESLPAGRVPIVIAPRHREIVLPDVGEKQPVSG